MPGPAVAYSAVPWLLLALLLTISVPLFVATPLTSDTVLYDMQARTVLNGGVLYRDVLEPNLPGIVWLHLLIRSLIGWSSQAIRFADLLIVGSSIWLLSSLAVGKAAVRSTEDISHRRSVQGWLILLMAVFYLSRNEWCHCQRDSWMLLPCLLALQLRVRRATVVMDSDVRVVSCLAEGLIWGTAFWIKPHVAIPVVAMFVAEIWTTNTRRCEFLRSAIIVAGGLLAAVPGVCWLVQTEAWPHFLDMQLNWNPEYLRAGAERRSWDRVWQLLVRFHPWWMVHVAGLVALLGVVAGRIPTRRVESEIAPADRTTLVLGVFAVTWLLQASLLQHAMDYIHVPAILLMLGFLAATSFRLPAIPIRVAYTTLLTLGLIASPHLTSDRLQQFPAAIASTNSWQSRNVLACGRFPNWSDLGHVVDFLKTRNVRAGDVTCYSVHTIHVYAALNLPSSTRYVGIAVLPELFPSHRSQIETTVAECGHRFVVSDDAEVTPRPNQFPWNLPVVFESGTIKVRAAAAPFSLTVFK